MNHLRDYATNITAAAVGTNGKDAFFGIAAAAIGIIGTSLGGWDKGMILLLWLMAGDYVTGLLGAIKTKTVNSDVMYWGGIRKIVVLFVIGLAFTIDGWLNPDAPVFRTIAIYFYVGREGLSVVENLGKMGVGIPDAIKDKLQQLNDKGGGKNG